MSEQEALPGLSHKEACVAKARDDIHANQARFERRLERVRDGVPWSESDDPQDH